MKFTLCALAGLLSLALTVRAQTTAFTYQGQLSNSNGPATGSYDFRFQVYGGSGVVAGPLTNAPVGVTNGLFTVTLDFGTGVFDGTARSLEIGVRGFGTTNAYAVLAPRQTLTSVPYAIQAINASNAVVLTGPLPVTNLVGTIPNSLLSANVAILTNNVTFSGSVTAAAFNGSFIGNGSGLTSVPGTSLTGTIPDARLSANVALQSNPILNFAGAVFATNFTGAGRGLTNVPGAFFWITNAGASTPILPNMGFITTNDFVPVVLTLPSSPVAGDVYKVAGLGAAGWIIAQNANQSILTGNLSDSIGASWTARDSSRVWTAVASSADGTKLAATVKGGNIYVSANSGATWVSRGSALNWSSIAASADGGKMVATVGDTVSATGDIYNSADSGTSWTASGSGNRQWVSVASSADGTKQVEAVYNTAGSGNPGVYVNGARQLIAPFSSAVASSADGTKLVAVVNSGTSQGIWTSTNSGTWLQRTNSGGWVAVASSADGIRLVAALNNGTGGQIYVSADGGVTWNTSSPSFPWTAVASSADGSHLAAAASSGAVCTSTDSGGTWVQRFGLPASSWTGVAGSADGSKLVLVGNSSQIYTSSQGSTTSGPTGYLFGPQHSAIELIYVGNNLFLPLSHEGTIRAY